jgi:hypothetical protein
LPHLEFCTFSSHPPCSAGYPTDLLVIQPYLRAVTEAAQLREDERTACLETALGKTLKMIGDYAGAQPSYQRALAIRERALGPDHPNVAGSLNNLATLYHAQGRYRAAELLYQRALAIVEEVFGPDYPHVALCLNNLVGLYYADGRYATAEQPSSQHPLPQCAMKPTVLSPRNLSDLHTLTLTYRGPLRGTVCKARQHILYICAELTRLTLNIPA